jgi:hypothetical protein
MTLSSGTIKPQNQDSSLHVIRILDRIQLEVLDIFNWSKAAAQGHKLRGKTKLRHQRNVRSKVADPQQVPFANDVEKDDDDDDDDDDDGRWGCGTHADAVMI